MPLLITGCTNRKRIGPDHSVTARTLAVGHLEAVRAEWLDRLDKARVVAEAVSLYCGRSIVEIRGAARAANAGLAFISAGLGIVCADTAIPSYSLTVSGRGPDAVLGRITPACSPADWWSGLEPCSRFGRGTADLAREHGGLLICALPQAYLLMAAPGLISLAESGAIDLRIITAARKENIDQRLHRWTMPYDDRLDGPDSPISGTLGDFPARAARHFVEAILSREPRGAASQHARSVDAALSRWRPSVSRVGRRCSDDEVMALLRKHWQAAEGRSTALLRVLRDDLGIACEQGRFANLARKIRAERGLHA